MIHHVLFQHALPAHMYSYMILVTSWTYTEYSILKVEHSKSRRTRRTRRTKKKQPYYEDGDYVSDTPIPSDTEEEAVEFLDDTVSVTDILIKNEFPLSYEYLDICHMHSVEFTRDDPSDSFSFKDRSHIQRSFKHKPCRDKSCPCPLPSCTISHQFDINIPDIFKSTDDTLKTYSTYCKNVDLYDILYVMYKPYIMWYLMSCHGIEYRCGKEYDYESINPSYFYSRYYRELLIFTAMLYNTQSYCVKDGRYANMWLTKQHQYGQRGECPALGDFAEYRKSRRGSRCPEKHLVEIYYDIETEYE